jgi:hypothetical protein
LQRRQQLAPACIQQRDAARASERRQRRQRGGGQSSTSDLISSSSLMVSRLNTAAAGAGGRAAALAVAAAASACAERCGAKDKEDDGGREEVDAWEEGKEAAVLETEGGKGLCLTCVGGVQRMIHAAKQHKRLKPTVLLSPSSAPSSESGESSSGKTGGGLRLGLWGSAEGLITHSVMPCAQQKAMRCSDLLGGAASDEKLNLDAVEDFSGWGNDDDEDEDEDEDEDAAVEEDAEPFGDDSDEISRSRRHAPPADGADEEGIPRLQPR